jgi:hypothetical protein
MTLPAAVPAEAVTVTLCAVPGVKLSVAGFTVTPVGRPVIATLTIPVKPLAGTALTLIACPVPPGISETLAGVALRVKSPAGGGGVDPPPQDVSRSTERKLIPARVFKQGLIAPPRIGLLNLRQPGLRAPVTLPRRYTGTRPPIVIGLSSIGQICCDLSDIKFQRLNC